MQSAITAKRIANTGATEEGVQLERLLHRQRVLAWVLSIFTFALTVGFFALMGFDAPVLSRLIFGQSITAANVIAVGMIFVFLLSIAFFGWRAARVDEELLNGKRGR